MESDGSPLPSSRASTPSSAALATVTAASSTAASETPKRTKICVYCGASTGKNPVYLEAARDLARAMAANNIGLVYGGGTVGLMGELARTLVALAGPDAVHGIIPEALVRYERDPEYTSKVGQRSRSQTDDKQNADQDASAHDSRSGSQSPRPGPVSGSGTSSGADAGPSRPSSPTLAVPAKELYGKTTVVRDMHTRKRIMAQEVINAGPGSGFLALCGGYGTLEELLETSTWNQLGIHSKGVCVLNINGFYDGLLAWIRKSVDEGFISPGNAGIIVEAHTAEDAVRALREYKVAPAVLKLAWGKE